MSDRNHGRSFDGMIRAIGPFVAMAAMGGLMAARNNAGAARFASKFTDNFEGRFGGKFAPGPGRGGKFRFNGREGVPLDQLDMTAAAPGAVVLVSGDHVVIESGADLAITLQGDDAAKGVMRFALEDGALFIMRDGNAAAAAAGNDDAADDRVSAAPATITIAMPAPHKITIIGSGTIVTNALADYAAVQIGGSGSVRADNISVDKLAVSIAGSGHLQAGGTARKLDLVVAGSGLAKLTGLKVEKAKVTIAGSGDADFSSDGEVKASLLGSGNVTVRGSARCKVQSIGSGTLVCERQPDAGAQEAA